MADATNQKKDQETQFTWGGLAGSAVVGLNKGIASVPAMGHYAMDVLNAGSRLVSGSNIYNGPTGDQFRDRILNGFATAENAGRRAVGASDIQAVNITTPLEKTVAGVGELAGGAVTGSAVVSGGKAMFSTVTKMVSKLVAKAAPEAGAAGATIVTRVEPVLASSADDAARAAATLTGDAAEIAAMRSARSSLPGVQSEAARAGAAQAAKVSDETVSGISVAAASAARAPLSFKGAMRVLEDESSLYNKLDQLVTRGHDDLAVLAIANARKNGTLAKEIGEIKKSDLPKNIKDNIQELVDKTAGMKPGSLASLRESYEATKMHAGAKWDVMTGHKAYAAWEIAKSSGKLPFKALWAAITNYKITVPVAAVGGVAVAGLVGEKSFAENLGDTGTSAAIAAAKLPNWKQAGLALAAAASQYEVVGDSAFDLARGSLKATLRETTGVADPAKDWDQVRQKLSENIGIPLPESHLNTLGDFVKGKKFSEFSHDAKNDMREIASLFSDGVSPQRLAELKDKVAKEKAAALAASAPAAAVVTQTVKENIEGAKTVIDTALDKAGDFNDAFSPMAFFKDPKGSMEKLKGVVSSIPGGSEMMAMADSHPLLKWGIMLGAVLGGFSDATSKKDRLGNIVTGMLVIGFFADLISAIAGKKSLIVDGIRLAQTQMNAPEATPNAPAAPVVTTQVAPQVPTPVAKPVAALTDDRLAPTTLVPNEPGIVRVAFNKDAVVVAEATSAHVINMPAVNKSAQPAGTYQPPTLQNLQDGTTTNLGGQVFAQAMAPNDPAYGSGQKPPAQFPSEANKRKDLYPALTPSEFSMMG